MMIQSRPQYITNTFNFFIIILPTNYKNNLFYYLFIFDGKFVTISKQKDKNFALSEYYIIYIDKSLRINIKKNKK